MKRRETEEAEETSGAGVIAPIVATAAAAFTLHWVLRAEWHCLTTRLRKSSLTR